VTASALATQQGIAMTLRQAGPGGRHRKTSQAAAGWTVPRQHTTSHAAAGRTTPRHRKASPAAASRTTPRHRKKGRGTSQAVYPSFGNDQGNSIWTATRRAALPSAFALGVLAVGGAITAGFSMPSPDAIRAEGNSPGGMMYRSMPSPPALTAESSPSSETGITLPPMADRGVRAPIGPTGPAWPISDQAATAGGSGDDGAGEPAQNGTTTRTRVGDRVPEPGAFAPSVTADPSSGHGGGGGPAESSAPPEPSAVGDGGVSGVFGPDGLLNGPAGGPGDDGNQDGVAGGAGRYGGEGRDGSVVGNPYPGSKGPDHPGRVDRPGDARDTGGRGGAGRGFGSPGKGGDARSPGDSGSDRHSGPGGQGRRGASRR
jgi:hypothetical protein